MGLKAVACKLCKTVVWQAYTFSEPQAFCNSCLEHEIDPLQKMADILIFLSAFKLASLASFREKCSLIFELKNEVSEANLNAKQRILKC